MNGKYVHYLPGGGLGDVARELLYHNALGILKRWKLRHPDAHLKIITMSHNPAHADFFVGQSWIDELATPRFPLEKGWGWESCYDWFPEEFADRTELRFTLPDKASLYRVDFNRLRKRVTAVETIQPIGMAADIVLRGNETSIVEFNADTLIVHPFAGEAYRCLPEWLLSAIMAQAGHRAVIVGADYARDKHAEETNAYENFRVHTFPPRVLLSILRRARGVVATESSVYYMAAMHGVPVQMLYARGGTFDLVRQGRNDWAWYYGEGESDNQFDPIPSPLDDTKRLFDWVKARR